MKKKGKNVYDDFAQTFRGLKSSLESEGSVESIGKKSIDKREAKNNTKNETIEQNTIEKKSIDKEEEENNARRGTIEEKSIEKKSKVIKSIGNKRAKVNIENRSIEYKTIEKESIDKKEAKNSVRSDTMEQKSIEEKSKAIESIDNKEATNNIENRTIEQKSIEQNKEETKPLGIHPTSIRVVKEELLKALAGQVSAEIKIGDIAPLTGLTRRTVDRVCKYLEGNGDFSFKRQHRGMKVTALKS
jgi:hypothetical protein